MFVAQYHSRRSSGPNQPDLATPYAVIGALTDGGLFTRAVKPRPTKNCRRTGAKSLKVWPQLAVSAVDPNAKVKNDTDALLGSPTCAEVRREA
jgi:hypothetical protein